MQQGVVLTSGLQNWQIIQQQNGFESVKLAGWYFIKGLPSDTPVKITARIVSETNGETVINWTECQRNGLNWHVVIDNIPAGGLYRMETTITYPGANGLSVTRGDMIHHFGVGDVFLIAGQSNASGRAKDTIYDPPALGVHILRNSGLWDLASHPLNETTDAILTPHLEHSNPSHCPFLSFGKRMMAELNYPIGLIQTAVGGTGLWQWNPEEEGSLYDKMLNYCRKHSPKIKGVMWYQGCADAFEQRYHDYTERFENMVICLRRDMDQPDLSFLTVQLNRCLMETNESIDISWGKLREAQRIAADKIPGVYIVPSLDLPLYDVVHNNSAANITLGERLAKAALGALYKKAVAWKAPYPESCAILCETVIRLTLGGIMNMISTFDSKPENLGFTLTDSAGVVNPCAYRVEGNTIELEFDRKIEKDAFLSGLWHMNPPYPPLCDMGGLPMLSFYGLRVE